MENVIAKGAFAAAGLQAKWCHEAVAVALAVAWNIAIYVKRM